MKISVNRGKITKTFDPGEKREEKNDDPRVKKGMLENKMEKEYINVSDVGYKEKRGSGNDTVKRGFDIDTGLAFAKKD